MTAPKTYGDSRVYFASFDEPEFAGRLLAKVEESAEDQRTNAVRALIDRAYLYYYGFDPETGIHATSAIARGGEVGELAQYRVNHARAVCNTLLNLVVSERVAFQPRATNVDYESLKQVEVSKAVLEYYWTEKRLERLVYRATEEAIAFSEGYVLALWDEMSGEDTEEPDVGILEALFDTQTSSPAPAPQEPAAPQPDIDLTAVKPRKTGDFTFENVSTWNVFRDSSKKSYEALNWVAVKVWRNKFDLAAQFPEYAEDILSAPIDEFGSSSVQKTPASDSSEDIPVLIFFHKRTPAVPSGREAWVLGNKTVLKDGSLSYDEIPLIRITPAEMVAAPFGYTPFFEILGLQELIDSLETTAATNLTTFGTQNIFLPAGSEIQADQLSGAVRIIQGGPDGREPKALQLCATPAELYKHLADKKRDLEMVFGVNAVVRGQVESDKFSGALAALLEETTKRQSSALHGSYQRAVQSLGDFIIATMRKRATAPRTIDIVGKENAFMVLREEQYTGKSFGAIKRVLVDIGNPLSQSIFGRMELVKELVQMGLVANLEQVFEVLSTGRTEPVTAGLTHELMNIRSENERIADGELPQALIHDNHLLHGREHRTAVASPQARKDPSVLKAAMEHIHQHYEAYFGVPAMQPQVDPMGQPVLGADGQPVTAPEPMYRTRMLVLMGIQPPDPALMGGMPPPGGAQPGAQPQLPGAPAPMPPQDPNQNTPGIPGSEPGQLAKPSKLPDMPKNPSSGQQWSPENPG